MNTSVGRQSTQLQLWEAKGRERQRRRGRRGRFGGAGRRQQGANARTHRVAAQCPRRAAPRAPTQALAQWRAGAGGGWSRYRPCTPGGYRYLPSPHEAASVSSVPRLSQQIPSRGLRRASGLALRPGRTGAIHGPSGGGSRPLHVVYKAQVPCTRLLLARPSADGHWSAWRHPGLDAHRRALEFSVSWSAIRRIDCLHAWVNRTRDLANGVLRRRACASIECNTKFEVAAMSLVMRLARLDNYPCRYQPATTRC